MIALLQPFEIKEVMRTGRVAMPRAALEEGGEDGFNVKSPEPPVWVSQSSDTGSV
jgi:hypothetical protein